MMHMLHITSPAFNPKLCPLDLNTHNLEVSGSELHWPELDDVQGHGEYMGSFTITGHGIRDLWQLNGSGIMVVTNNRVIPL